MIKKIQILTVVVLFALTTSTSCALKKAADEVEEAQKIITLLSLLSRLSAFSQNTYTIGYLTTTSVSAGGAYTVKVNVYGTSGEFLDIYFSTDSIITNTDTKVGYNYFSDALNPTSTGVYAPIATGTYYVGLYRPGSGQVAISYNTVTVY
ncbi:MAG: hypothetical protein OEZ34_17095 [Spirochaetia bacterium]|nr:hypothetical protein [Spirochaetia bacterium]